MKVRASYVYQIVCTQYAFVEWMNQWIAFKFIRTFNYYLIFLLVLISQIYSWLWRNILAHILGKIAFFYLHNAIFINLQRCSNYIVHTFNFTREDGGPEKLSNLPDVVWWAKNGNLVQLAATLPSKN